MFRLLMVAADGLYSCRYFCDDSYDLAFRLTHKAVEVFASIGILSDADEKITLENISNLVCE